MQDELKNIRDLRLTCDSPEIAASSEQASHNRNQHIPFLSNGSIDIRGIDKAELLAALHNGTQAVGYGILHDLKRDITVEEARKDWENMQRRGFGTFDYYHGRPLKVSLAGDVMFTFAYDRDAGPGTAERIIAALRSKATNG
jgi:hypothetical protein